MTGDKGLVGLMWKSPIIKGDVEKEGGGVGGGGGGGEDNTA